MRKEWWNMVTHAGKFVPLGHVLWLMLDHRSLVNFYKELHGKTFNKEEYRAIQEEKFRRTGGDNEKMNEQIRRENRGFRSDNDNDEPPTGASGGGGNFSVIQGGKSESSHNFEHPELVIYGLVALLFLVALLQLQRRTA